MEKTIAISNVLRLDKRTRTLSRITDGKSVTLPASACRCLKALVEAKEEVLSQEQLMDIGWRSAGVEVTDNSVRVMITKIRRALATLKVDDGIQLVAVTRSGYRLIIRKDVIPPLPSSPANPTEKKSPLKAKTAAVPQQNPTQPRPAATAIMKKRFAAGIIGLALGGCAALLASGLFKVSPHPIHFVRWTGADAPPQAEVWVPQEARGETGYITQTLQLYKRYVIDQEQDMNTENARYLYITIGKSSQHLGLIACVTPLRKSENNCESYYFKYR